MKTNLRPWLLGATIALLGLTFAVRAEDAAPSAAPADNPASAAVVSQAPATPANAEPVAPNAAATQAEPTAQTAEPMPAPQPAPTETAPASPAPDTSAANTAKDAGAQVAENPPPAPESPVAPSPERRPARRRSGDQDRVGLFTNVSVAKGESANTVVAILGNATAQGPISDSVVAIFGNARVEDRVGDSIVAVIGNVYVDSKVHDVVAVLGNIELGPNAEVYGDAVAVGGLLKRDPKAIVHGDTPTIALPIDFGAPDWLQIYLSQCVQKLRPLAFAPGLGWAWGIAIGFLVFYALLALLFRGGVETSIATLESRPGRSVLTSFLALVLSPIVILLLLITVVGIAVVPFLTVGLMCATLFGRAVMLAWIGTRITRLFGKGPMSHPAIGVLVGGVIVLALYTVPVVGVIVYKLLGFLGLGVVIYTLLRARKASKPTPATAVPGTTMPRPAGAPASALRLAPLAPVVSTPPAASAQPETAAGGSSTPADTGFAGAYAAASAVAEPPMPQMPPAPDAAATLPRAGFWIRTAAMLLDVFLVLLVMIFVSEIVPFMGFSAALTAIVLAAYAAVLWKLKGTTVGGIICGLRVVRLDNRPVDWPTAVVRALGCFVSLFGVFLGFIWVAFDDERQSWHDKIAGTTVVQVRGNQSLV